MESSSSRRQLILPECASAVCEMLNHENPGILNWVQCDKCDTWYHLICVCPDETIESIAEKKFVCDKCDINATNNDVTISRTEAPSGNAMFSEFLEALKSVKAAPVLPALEVPFFSGKVGENFFDFKYLFETVIGSNCGDPRNQLQFLLKYTRSQAHELIKSCIYFPGDEGISEAWKRLDRRFGGVIPVVRQELERLTMGPPFKFTDRVGLLTFSDQLSDTAALLKRLGHDSDANSPDRLKHIVRRFPIEWKNELLKRLGDRMPTFNDLVEVAEKCSKKYSNPFFADVFPDGDSANNNKKFRNASINVMVEQKCALCSREHPIWKCAQFLSCSVNERRDIVNRKGLCRACLRMHAPAECRSRLSCRTCQKAGVDSAHNYLLCSKHAVSPSVNSSTADASRHAEPTFSSAGGSAAGTTEGPASVNANTQGNGNDILVQVVPVNVTVKNGAQLSTYAMLDSGSNCTICDMSLLDHLNIRGTPVASNMSTVDKAIAVRGERVSLRVSPATGHGQPKEMNVLALSNLEFSKARCTYLETVRRNDHLQEVGVVKVNIDKVLILIGTDHPECFLPLDSRYGPEGAPIAIKGPLGWSILGPAVPSSGSSRCNNLVHIAEKFWKIEDELQYSSRRGASMEDKKASSAVKMSMTKKDGRYQVGIPWRRFPPSLKTNREYALLKFNQLLRRFAKDNEYANKYADQVDNCIKKHYAEKVPASQKPQRFITHHGVINPKKPGKVRVVFNCADEFGGCLNDEIHRGPDVLCSLVGVLLRFREGQMAMSADIQEMYHQVLLAKQDEPYFNFWWLPEGSAEEPTVYRMTRHVFGCISSSFCTNVVLKNILSNLKYEEQFRTVEAVDCFYVDDFLFSFDDRSGIEFAERLTDVLRENGFNLRDFSGTLNVGGDGKELLSVLDDPDIKGALGLRWSVKNDSLKFLYKSKEFEDPLLSKRKVLSTCMSLWDPLGWLNVVLIEARIFLQDLVRRKLDWDEALSSLDIRSWQAIGHRLERVCQRDLPRCVLAKESEHELHLFCDASQEAYAAVAYARPIDASFCTSSMLMMSKARVAPIKTMTIVRLELQAALLAARLADSIQQESRVRFVSTAFWTDSVAVLNYLKNESTRFKIFVANRIHEIQELSRGAEWKYVNTRHNPADLATRKKRTLSEAELDKWFIGPDWNFLMSLKKSMQPALISDLPEIKKECHQISMVNKEEFWINLIVRYSSLRKLHRHLAILLRFVRWFRDGRKAVDAASKILTLAELKEVELRIIASLQRREWCFDDESWSENIVKGLTVFKDSSVECVTILRVRTRISMAEVSFETACPILIPAGHYAELVLRDSHLPGHVGINHTLHKSRERFWIIKGRKLAKRLINKCIPCKRLHGRPLNQIMAPLPEFRLKASYPFENTGVDLFGPIMVKVLRSRAKRYGVLFTCLGSRAIHLEVASDLSTNGFLAALRRFICRRGMVKNIYSDQGTNFIGASQEIRATLDAVETDILHRELAAEGISWTFIAARASHHGGAWERMIRSVKAILFHTLNGQIVTEDALHTLLCEAEYIVNSRPLCPVSDDPNDFKASSPNDILITKIPANIATGSGGPESVLRGAFKASQHMANIFWSRFVKEYIPLLSRRQKWNRQRRDVAVGDLVVISDALQPRSIWPMARVIGVQANNQDGHVRSATVRLASGKALTRPISKLILLECAE